MDRARACEWIKCIWPHLSRDELRGDDYVRFTQFIAGQLTNSTYRRSESDAQVVSLVRALGKLESDSFTREGAIEATQRVLSASSNSQLVHPRTVDLALRIMFT